MSVVWPNAELLVSVELMRMLLDLPSDYRVLGATTGEVPGTFSLLLYVDFLPDVPWPAKLHLIDVTYRQVNTQRAELLSVNITPSGER